MSRPIEDYALLGDTESAALVGRDGSIDWMCLPQFDSDACFAALIGGEGRGRFRIAPASPVRSTTRRYRPGTLVLETTFATDEGVVRVVDAMPPRDGTPDVARVVEGVRGRVPMRVELAIRFGYGVVVPWIRRRGGGVYTAVGGPDALALQADHAFEVRDAVLGADLTVSAGERVPFRLAWFESHRSVPERTDPIAAIGATERWWAEWTAQSSYRGGWRKHVLRSLVTLKALTHAPTGGIVAAPTTSLPELRGGTRNWDYRYCWLRDATFTLDALMATGFHEEGQAFCDWLARSVAGDARQIQIMYGVGGERRLTGIRCTPPVLKIPARGRHRLAHGRSSHLGEAREGVARERANLRGILRGQAVHGWRTAQRRAPGRARRRRAVGPDRARRSRPRAGCGVHA